MPLHTPENLTVATTGAIRTTHGIDTPEQNDSGGQDPEDLEAGQCRDGRPGGWPDMRAGPVGAELASA